MNRTSMKHLMAPVLVLMFALLAACGSPSTDSTEGGYVSGDDEITVLPESEREPAPQIEGESVGGQEIDLSQWSGDIVVVNLWGSWCPPCREESPALDKVARETESEGVHFLGLSTRESPDTTEAFIDKHDVSYPSIYDEGAEFQVAFADSMPSQAIPTTWVIDGDGNVAARAMTVMTESTLTELIERVRDDDNGDDGGDGDDGDDGAGGDG